MKRRRSPAPGLVRSNDGNAAVEFALVGPLFLLLLIGLVVYGGWFWMAIEVQHFSNEGARAAIAGLSDAERESLARAAILGDGSSDGLVPVGDVEVSVVNDDGTVSVSVAYSAADHPFMAFAQLVPAPPMDIRRVSVIQTGEG